MKKIFDFENKKMLKTKERRRRIRNKRKKTGLAVILV
jgi:hypothetical protein